MRLQPNLVFFPPASPASRDINIDINHVADFDLLVGFEVQKASFGGQVSVIIELGKWFTKRQGRRSKMGFVEFLKFLHRAISGKVGTGFPSEIALE